jgi:tetratricopeptide (TPR) repeat protein
VDLQPRSVEGNSFLARALYGARDYKEAVTAAKRSLQLDSSNTDVWRAYGESCAETGDFGTAVGAFEALKRRNAFKTEDNSSYGNALFRLGREEEALRALLSAVETDSTNCDPYASLGVIYMKRQDYATAALYFEKKIVCTPGSITSYVNAAACYMQVKNFPRTRELLTRVVELKPDYLQGRLWLGRYFAQVDSLEMAKAEYDEVLKIVSANPEKYKKEAGEAYQQIGQYYFLTKQFERVADAMRRATQAGQENSSVHLMWGQAVLQLLDPQEPQEDGKRKKEEAVRHFRRSVELDPNSPSAHLWLAQGLIISRVEGDNKRNKELLDEACIEYRKVLKLDPRNADAQKGMNLYGCK